jgi:AraC-like DNA-binding protein
MPRGSIRVWRPLDVAGVELRQGLCVQEPVQRHWHDEYQLCLVEAGGGELRHGGVSHPTPPGSLFVVAPGDVHSNESRVADGCSFRSLYLPAELLKQAAAELGRAALPDFARPVIHDPPLFALCRSAHSALDADTPRLEREARLLQAMVALVGTHAAGSWKPRPPGREGAAVRRARDYLHQHFRDPVSSAELAAVARLSAFHLSRVFRSETGLPPHAYQNQLRVHYARRLIQAGLPLVQVAQMAGFADQSHLVRRFRRAFAVPPGAYQRRDRKNVQDTSLPPS